MRVRPFYYKEKRIIMDSLLKKLVLLGGGGHCKSVLDTLLKTKEYDEIVITDPKIPAGTEVMGCKVVGNDDVLPELFAKGYKKAFITAGDVGLPNPREKMVKYAQGIGFQFPNIIDPSAYISESANIGEGNYIGKKAIINVGVKVGNHCIINTASIIEHEAVIGDVSHVATGAIVLGEVVLGDRCFVGAGSTIVQCKKLGNDVKIGAGAVVTDNLPDNCMAVGVPARIIK